MERKGNGKEISRNGKKKERKLNGRIVHGIGDGNEGV